MLGSNVSSEGLRWWIRGVSRCGTLCALVAALALTTGCPPPPDACTGFDPDDADACTTDTCEVVDGVATPVNTPIACADGETCVDGACVTDLCAGNTCDDGDPCNGTETCDAATGDCVAGTAVDCPDDGVFCNGTESCDATGACVSSGDPCDAAAGETCDEATAACITECTLNADCDDGDLCTDDACVSNACVFTAVDCDDGLFCTGVETCNATTGACDSAGDPCAAGETCNEATDTCDAPPPCTTDADCADDGVFCNGTETCDTASGTCTSSGDPCAAGELCDEASAACVGCLVNADCPAATPICTSANVCVECEADTDCTAGSCVNNVCVTTIEFTLNQDNLFGTIADDTFNAPLLLNNNGVQVASLQTGDSADGKDGVDELTASFSATAGVNVVPTLSNIETLNISDFGSATSTVKLGNASGVTTINNKGSVRTATVTDIGTAANLGIINSDQGISATYKAAATSGTTDSVTLSLSGVTGGTATITTDAASGFETVTVDSTGGTSNTLDNLTTAGNTSTLKTLNVTGDTSVKVKVVPNSLTTKIDASGMTGTAGVTLGTGTSITGTSAYTTFGTFDIGNLTGGPGDDTFIFGSTLTTADADGTTEFIDGGDGTDVLQATIGAGIATAAHIKNIEELRLNATGNFSMSLTNVTGISMFTIESDATASGSQNTLTLSNFPNIPMLDYRGNGAEASQFFDAVTYTTLGGSGGSDSLAITVGNRGTALGSSGSSNAFNVGLITAANIETLTVTIADTPPSASSPTTLGGITANGMTTLNMTASGDVVLGTIVGKTDGLTSVNLSSVNGRIKSTSTITTLDTGSTVTLTSNNDTVAVTTGNNDTGVTVNCGSGDDTITSTGTGTGTVTINGEAGDDNLTGTANGDTVSGGNGNDTLNGGAGADTITGGSGNDTITGGSGNDTITGGSGNDAITGGAGADLITGGTGVDTYTFTDDATNGIDVFTLETGDLDGTAVDDVFDFATNEDLIGATADVKVCTAADITAADCSTASGDNVVILTADFFPNAAAVVTATGVLAGLDTGDIVLIYSSSGSADARIMVATMSAGGDVTAGNDVAVITGLTVAEAATGFANANFTTD